MQCSAVQYSAVQYSVVQFSAVQCSEVKCSTVQCSEVQCSAVQCSAVQCSSLHCCRGPIKCASVQSKIVALYYIMLQRAEDNENEDDCYFDLKAFLDGIPHHRCLASLHAHGVSQEGKVHKWVTVYLGAGGESQEGEDVRSQEKEQDKEQVARIQEQEAPQKAGRRRQQVILNGKASRWHDGTASIVQGSVLGPTLAKCFFKFES